MPVEITDDQMNAAKQQAADLLRIRLRAGTVQSIDRSATDIVAAAAADSDPRVLQALVVALVQFGWMTADFLTRCARGHELNATELELLIDMLQSDSKG